MVRATYAHFGFLFRMAPITWVIFQRLLHAIWGELDPYWIACVRACLLQIYSRNAIRLFVCIANNTWHVISFFVAAVLGKTFTKENYISSTIKSQCFYWSYILIGNSCVAAARISLEEKSSVLHLPYTFIRVCGNF